MGANVYRDGKYIGFRVSDIAVNGFIYLQYCPVCNRENWAMAVATGKCCWCGYDANAVTTDAHIDSGELGVKKTLTKIGDTPQDLGGRNIKEGDTVICRLCGQEFTQGNVEQSGCCWNCIKRKRGK